MGRRAYRCTACEVQKTDDAQATEHLENGDSLGFLDVENIQYESNPEGYNGDKISPVERMSEIGSMR
jgi:hypothetical protein